MVLQCDAEWEINRENLNLLDVIGEGAFGKVLKADAFGLNKGNMSKTVVAVKTLKGNYLLLNGHIALGIPRRRPVSSRIARGSGVAGCVSTH